MKLAPDAHPPLKLPPRLFWLVLILALLSLLAAVRPLAGGAGLG
jgi:hypothetical protein